ncbi:MAG: YgjV family protein [Firmicutes bacterium]|nr:YgjV family protein [Bacillota bacterium]
MNLSIELNITVLFVLSQIFTFLSYAAFAASYTVRTRFWVLALGVLNVMMLAIGLALLGSWLSMMALSVALIRNLSFLIKDLLVDKKFKTLIANATTDKEKEAIEAKKKARANTITTPDIIIFCVVMSLLAQVTILNAVLHGFDIYEFFSIIATATLSVSLLQKNVKIYRILSIPVSIFWIIVLIAAKSPVGIILECVLLGIVIASVIFYSIIEKKDKELKILKR